MKAKKTAPPIAPAVPAVVLVKRASRAKRALARENPQAYPEISSSELLSDLENDDLDQEEG
jgi:hypothetical protein